MSRGDHFCLLNHRSRDRIQCAATTSMKLPYDKLQHTLPVLFSNYCIASCTRWKILFSSFTHKRNLYFRFDRHNVSSPRANQKELSRRRCRIITNVSIRVSNRLMDVVLQSACVFRWVRPRYLQHRPSFPDPFYLLHRPHTISYVEQQSAVWVHRQNLDGSTHTQT